MAKDPDLRYATTVELAEAAHDAVTAPIARPAPTSTQPLTEQATRPAALPANAHGLRTAQPTGEANSLVPAKPAPPQPTPPTPPRAGAISRRTTIALIAGAIALVAVVAAAVGIPALVEQQPFGASSSSSPTTSSERPEPAQVVLPFTGLNSPGDVAVDSAGTLYVTDDNNNRVLELSAGSSTQTVLAFTGLSYPDGVAVDSSGNVYVADSGNNRVVKLPAR